MPGGSGPKFVGSLLAGGALVALLAGCGDDSQQQNQPPPPAAFGQVHDWGSGNNVSVSAPRDVQTPGLVPSGNQNLMVFNVTVRNGGGQPVALNSYPVEVKVDGQTVSAAALGGYNSGQVLSNGGQSSFVEVAEAPNPGQRVEVTVQGAGDQARPAITFAGTAPEAK